MMKRKRTKKTKGITKHPQDDQKVLFYGKKPFSGARLNPIDWQYLEAFLYQSLRSQPIIEDLLNDASLHIVVLSVSGSDLFYLGAYAGEGSFHPHNHVLKCHILQICLALDLISEKYYKEEIEIDCGQMRRLFGIEPKLLISCAKQIKEDTSHH